MPASIAADAVITLFTDPGSYASVTVRFRIAAGVAVPKLLGFSAGQFAIASTSPVFASSTTAVPFCAPVERAPRARACSA